MVTNSTNPCRGLLWSVKRIREPSVRVGEVGNLFWKLSPGKPSSCSTVAELKENTLRKRETSSRQSQTVCPRSASVERKRRWSALSTSCRPKGTHLWCRLAVKPNSNSSEARKSRTESVRSKSPLTASPASPGPLSNSLHGSFHGSLGSDGMSCSSARSSSASPDSARYSSSQITKTDTRKPSVRRSGPPKEFINMCLETHNYYRVRHGVPPLRLSKQLCKTSQDWANILAAKGRLEHRANIDYGENLYCMWSSNPKTVVGGDEPVNEWYAEEALHQYGKEPTTLKTGHFTQVVWRDSTELGVGMARNRNGEVYVVCNYNPAGNFLGSFTDNVLPSGSTSPSKRISFSKSQYTLDEQAWQQEALLVHNEYRRRHRVPDLRLSPELTVAAKAWANTLLNTNKLIPQSSSPYGENIYSMQCSDPKLVVSAREVVSKWYSEKKEHKFGTEPKILNTCHFTQIIWKNTTEMGIAMAKRDGTCVVVACYHPRGNIVGQFTENVPKLVKNV
ncbi:uncharacterized protein LOC122632639 isoform X4 [Vespula pensylvanica]|uniref:uncharacterized protein LOC122632639 isoform X4 n=1 Tax=Vespula pensylvanica TaxID=30213 RepID=UPI001CBA0159|nr:uncharacterized protein LOC122632639 isoform X4 [Vespula pensylvanica]XP_043675636.1 uncharacterized protein LOC122632639 isoform X4 [Vespula pensylvanica]XP_043675637.1 uncharacterized protein LOC122632639 isoform X4 [Vespula pensylvanica]